MPDDHDPAPSPVDAPDSRTRILASGGRLFAESGYDSVTTRRIARDAAVNIAAISYHFGGKEALYRAILIQIVSETEPVFAPMVESLAAGVTEAAGNRRQLARAATTFVDSLLKAVLGDERMRWRMALVLREFHQPSSAFPILLEGRIAPLHGAVAALVAAATDEHPQSFETTVRAHAVIGQLMSFGMARTVLWARLDWSGYTAERVAELSAVVTPHVLASLGLSDPESPAGVAGRP